MKNLTDKAFRGLRVPESKEQSFNCSIHGKQSYTTYQRRDGSWADPYCPECRRVLHERETLLEGIKQEAKERAVELARALHCERPLDFDVPTFDNYVPESEEELKNLAICRRFAERFTDREIEREKLHNAQNKDWRSKNALGLLLFGNYGTGKSHLCYSILKSLDAQGIPGFYITIPDLFDRLSDKENRVDMPSVLAKLSMVSCLVLDEIGVQSGSEYEKKRLYQIIDGRIKNGRPTILITNLMKDELQNLVSERVYDRINQSTYRLMFTGRSRRESTKGKSTEELF